MLSVLAIISAAPREVGAALSAHLIDVHMVWDKAPYNAFTDLKRFANRWFLVFREAAEHGDPRGPGGQGVIRVLNSSDGMAWKSTAVLDAGPAFDLRDPHLAITPDGKLALFALRANRFFGSYRSVMWISHNGRDWGREKEVGDLDYPLWDVAEAPDGTLYATAYGPVLAPPWSSRLYASREGRGFRYVLSFRSSQGTSSEAALLFLKDGKAVALIRDEPDGVGSTIAVGRGRPLTWGYSFTPVFVGGPALIELPGGEVIAGGRVTKGGAHTALSRLDPEQGTLTELIRLPGGGDTGYPGLVWFDDMLWVSYYATERGKARIYIARVKFSATSVARIKPAPGRAGSRPRRPQPLDSALSKRIRALESERTALLERYTEAHPSVRQLEAQIKILKRQMGKPSP